MAVSVSLALVAMAGLGYGLGRGLLTVPVSLAERLPRPVLGWLPGSNSHLASTSPPPALADYAFELADPRAKPGEAVLTVRLIHRPTGEAVPGAIVYAHRLDMAPSGMPTMTAELEPQPATEPGTYRFGTNLTMAGDWQLALAAKVQGQRGTVQATLALKAVP